VLNQYSKILAVALMNPSTSHDTHHYVQAPQERDASETSLEHDVNKYTN
jgi:hypothetical protein